ncbi:hypothetical protein ABVT39_023696 [Epinephelus coioides]
MLRSGRAVTKPEDIADMIQNASDISDGIAALRSELSTLSIGLNAVREQSNENAIKIEQCISITSKLQKEQKSSNISTVECLRHIEKLTLKLADQEDRAQQNNIRISGLKEGAEGSNAVQFLATQLPLWIPALKDNPMDLERGHRIYSEKHNGHPRIMIFKCLRFSTRVAILREARRGKPIMFAEEAEKFANSPNLDRVPGPADGVDTPQASDDHISFPGQ